MKTIKIIVLTLLAYILATAVVLSSAHLRDIVANKNGSISIDTPSAIKVHVDDASAKSVSDLHSHVDKTMLKPFEKTAGDQSILNRQKQFHESLADSTRPLAVIIMEMLLMFRLTYAFALSH